MKFSIYLAVLQCVVFIVTCSVNGADLSVATSEKGFYNITVNGKYWLRGAHAFFYADGDMYTTEGYLGQQGNLILNETETDQGRDKLGAWKRITYNYFAGDKPIQLYIKSYTDDGVNVLIFGQRYVEDTNGTSAPLHEKIIGGFPNFDFIVPSTQKVGYLSFGGNWLGDEHKTITTYDGIKGANLADGFTGGPLCMFDTDGNTLIISPFNQFMAASSWLDGAPLYRGNMHWGIMGTVDFIPAGFEYETIMYYGNGINKAFEGWGELVRTWYDKTDLRNTDITLSYMGYWTDKGSAYYDAPEEGKNYEDTILDLKTNMDQLQMPYRYFQLDNWFYEKDENGGTVTWKAKNDIIPDGLTFLHGKTGLPVVLQNGFWSDTTPYATQNGGNFTFLINGSWAVPLGEDFWDFLFSQAKNWGLTVYQQDWMTEQTLSIPEFQTDVTLGRQWLMDMGRSAQRHGITIQYSGALPRHALQSLEIPAVTQARVSADFGLSRNQWRIGVTSMFANALGLAPFKDTFLSTVNDTDPKNFFVPYINAIVSILSAGPFGPGDRINNSHTDVTSRLCCNSEGLVLGPSKPATAIDLQIMEAAYNNSMGPKGEVWTTHSMIGDYKFGIIFGTYMNDNFTAKGSDLFGPDIVESVIYSPVNPIEMPKFSRDSTVFFPKTSGSLSLNLYTSPVFRIGSQKSEVVLLGESEKHVPISPKRVTSINVTSDAVTVTLVGVPGEASDFLYAVDGTWHDIICTFNATRQTVITISPGKLSTAATTITTITTAPVSEADVKKPLSFFVLCLVAILRLFGTVLTQYW